MSLVLESHRSAKTRQSMNCSTKLSGGPIPAGLRCARRSTKTNFETSGSERARQSAGDSRRERDLRNLHRPS